MTTSKKLIVAYVSVPEKLKFFLRFKSSAELEKIDFKVVTHCPSIKIQYPSAIFIKSPKILPVSDAVSELYNNSLEGKDLNSIVNSARAEGVYQQLTVLWEALNNDYTEIFCFLWNGSTLLEGLAADTAAKAGLKLRFFEIGNFPGKLFVDPVGVNSKSSIARVEHLREKYLSGFDRQSMSYWHDDYVKNSKRVHTVRQAVNLKKINWWFFLDWFWFLIFKPVVKPVSLVGKISSKLNRRKVIVIDEEIPKEYILYPCQVQSDSQLILNSKINNIDALEFISKSIISKDVKVVVKLHPAEPDSLEIKKIIDFCKENEFLISSRSVPDLLENAKQVITINSTVGIQALLFKKEIKVLGDAFYKDYSLDDLLGYIHHYLLDVDFFEKDGLCQKKLKCILERNE